MISPQARALYAHSLRQSLRGRRLVGLGLLALAPTLIVLGAQAMGATQEASGDLVDVVYLVGMNLVVPLTALFLGASVLRDELDTGSIIHLVTRGAHRRTVFLARLAAATTATVLLAVASLGLTALVTQGLAPGELAITVGIAALACLPYTGLFALLGVATGRAILVGLAYVVAWENVVASTPLLFRSWTVAYWARSLVAEADLAASDAAGLSVASSPAGGLTAALVLLAIAAAAAISGALWFAQRELPGAEPE